MSFTLPPTMVSMSKWMLLGCMWSQTPYSELSARTTLLISAAGMLTGSTALQIGHMKVLAMLLVEAAILLMAVVEKWVCLKVWFTPTSEQMVHTLTPYLLSLNSSLALPSVEILLGLTSTWLCLAVVELLVEVGRALPSLACLAAGPRVHSGGIQ